MKKNFIATIGIILASIMLVCAALTGCDFFGNNTDDAQSYTIQYSDDAGVHTLTVTEGKPYSLKRVPNRYGYEFLGLFDAQTGGTQYVGADGASLSPYTDKESKVLFPHFKPIDYTVILDYGEATVTGDRSLTVAYDENLPELPKNLTLEHNEFTGWYTEANRQGTQIADIYGNLPVVSVLNKENFKLDDSKRVYLYAGFELKTYTVTFYFDEGMAPEEVKVPYNTPVRQIVPKTRNEKAEAGLTWSKSRGGEVFDGNVTDDLVLYVKEWAPVIEFDGNGADVAPIVAKAGTAISLPTPVKPLAKFLRWEDENGEDFTAAEMPAESVALHAVWQGKIEFDENGGSDVTDISKPAGESITLPTPEKEGYIFAGWYTADKERYTQATMPSAGIALKAGWYKEKKDSITLVNNNVSDAVTSENDKMTETKCLLIDLSNVLKNIEEGIKIHFSVHFKWGSGSSNYSSTGQIALYEGRELNSDYCLASKSLSHGRDLAYWIEESLTGSATVHKNVLCLYYSGKSVGGPFNLTTAVSFFDVGINLTYPDVTNLYL